MKLLPVLCLLSLWASAQDASTLKYQVYSTYLNATIAAADSLMDTTYVRKSQSVFITPVIEWDMQEFRGATSMVNMYLQSKGIRRDTALVPQSLTAEAAAEMLDSWPQSWPRGSFRYWLDASPENLQLYFQLDSLLSAQQALRPLFRLNYSVVIGSSPAKALRKKKWDWDAFYRRWPGSFGIISLSEIAFTADKRRAVFYVAARQGGLAGGGNIVFMKDTPHGWEIEFSVTLWVS
jgi:hypothetical protein